MTDQFHKEDQKILNIFYFFNNFKSKIKIILKWNEGTFLFL
jgi:hypothetical protein